MTLIYDYVSGAIGGACGLLISHPFDTIRVTIQIKERRNINLFMSIKQVASGGMKNGFYRGLAFPLCVASFQSSIFFGTYGFCLNLLDPDLRQSKMKKSEDHPNYRFIVCAAFTAGLIQTVPICPPDRVKVVLQSQLNNLENMKQAKMTTSSSYGVKVEPGTASASRSHDLSKAYFYGPRDASRWLYHSYGWRQAFYRGYACLAMRDSIAFLVYMVSYEFLKRTFSSKLSKRTSKSSEIVSTLISGGLAGSLSWLAIMPFDVVKNVYQSDLTHTRYSNLWQCARHLYALGGFKIFFRGAGVASFQALMTNAVVFLTYTQSLQTFQRWHFSNKC